MHSIRDARFASTGACPPRRTEGPFQSDGERYLMRRSHGRVLAAIAVTPLSACGSSEPAASTKKKDAKVAPLVSTAAAPSSPPSTKAERLRGRLDTTPEEHEAVLGPY